MDTVGVPESCTIVFFYQAQEVESLAALTPTLLSLLPSLGEGMSTRQHEGDWMFFMNLFYVQIIFKLFENLCFIYFTILSLQVNYLVV